MGGWREGKDGRPAGADEPQITWTPILAVAGGVAANWLTLLITYRWEVVRLPGEDLASPFTSPEDVFPLIIWSGIVGAGLGGIGYRGQDIVAHHRAPFAQVAAACCAIAGVLLGLLFLLGLFVASLFGNNGWALGPFMLQLAALGLAVLGLGVTVSRLPRAAGG